MLPEFKTILDLVKTFPDAKSCHQYLAGRRWGGYMTCPNQKCKGDEAYVFKDGIRYKCKCCKKIYTARTGTIFESSRIPLQKWFMAMYLVMHKKGVSSHQLAKDLGITQKTSWFLLQRLRTVLGNEAIPKLSGTIQCDETFVGGKNKNRHYDKKVAHSQGRAFKDKTPVMGLLQKEEFETIERPHKVIRGRTVKEKVVSRKGVIKCFVVPDTKGRTIRPIVYRNVEQGSTVVSDEWHAYRGLGKHYNHQVVDHGRKQYVNEAGYTSNAVESQWSQFKRGINGVYHQVSRKHLQRYVDEFDFKYNHRTLGVQQQLDQFIVNMNCRLKYKDLIA